MRRRKVLVFSGRNYFQVSNATPMQVGTWSAEAASHNRMKILSLIRFRLKQSEASFKLCAAFTSLSFYSRACIFNCVDPETGSLPW